MSRKPPTQEQQNNGRNEYIPSYISKAPFYAEGLSDGDYLEHQRLHATPKDTLDKAKWYDRGRKAGPAATKFRKGACENCGAMTHKAKDCLSRPRKHGAKWTGKDIQADELTGEVKLGWDAKRDRWNGYDSREYSAVVQEYEDMENLRKAAQSVEAGQKLIEGEIEVDHNTPGDANNDDSEAKYAEETDMGRSQPTSTRQLRLREDTAKYLLNLDLDSAKYDPKTRSMDTTTQTLSTSNPTDSIAEEGFVRPSNASDDAAAFERAQRYAWETQEGNPTGRSHLPNPSDQSGKKLHLQANPTEGEFLMKKRDTEAAAKKEARRKFLADKYGDQTAHKTSNDNGSAHAASSSSAPGMAAIQSSTTYVEYDKHGNVKLPRGQVKQVARSKYPEDIHPNNHTSIFGSWWHNFTWGYACCHSTVKNSYCTGDEGRLAFEESEGLRTGETLLLEHQSNSVSENNNDSNVNPLVRLTREQAQKSAQEQNGEDIQERKDVNDTDTDTGRVPNVDLPSKKSQKRTFDEVTDEEMEAYKRNRMAASDPMRNLGDVGEDGLLVHR